VKNPFKPEEDPMGLSQARILSKQDMQICNFVYAAANRLQCLDANKKVDRDKCIDLLEKLQAQSEEKAIYELIKEIGLKKRMQQGVASEVAQGLSALNTDEVFRFARERLKAQLPKTQEVIERAPFKFEEVQF